MIVLPFDPRAAPAWAQRALERFRAAGQLDADDEDDVDDDEEDEEDQLEDPASDDDEEEED